VLSRELPNFPKHAVKDSTYIVSSWGGHVTAESWFYATHDTEATWSPGAPVLFAEVLENMMPKFLQKLKPLGFKTCRREAGTWKLSVSWRAPPNEHDDTDDSDGADTFADELTALVETKNKEEKEKQAVADMWEPYVTHLLDQAVELFKQRCIREAEAQRSEATVSFEVLSREIADFPKRIVRDSIYFVDSWGGDVTSECWFYATHGPHATFHENEPVLFAEVLECMMPKFLKRLKPLGFLECGREPGTWKVFVSWPDTETEAPAKRPKIEAPAKIEAPVRVGGA